MADKTDATKRITGNKLLPKVCEALNIDAAHIRRVVLDIPYDGVVTVFVELLGSTALIDIDWPGALSEAEIRIAENKS